MVLMLKYLGQCAQARHGAVSKMRPSDQTKSSGLTQLMDNLNSNLR